MTEQQRELEERASAIIWEAAGLRPGVPGHVTKTSLLVGKMRQLLREAQELARPEPVLPDEVDIPGAITEPPAEITVEQRQALLAVYTKPERRH